MKLVLEEIQEYKIGQNFSKSRILIVDDDRFMAKTIRSMLELYEVASIRLTSTLDDAIKIIEQGKIDCVFVDNMMSEKTGLDLTKKIRKLKNEENREVAIILCTAYTGFQSIVKARDAGVTEVLAKPVSPEQIMEKLDNALFNRRDFIISDVYSGPDRRRRIRDFNAEKDRRGVKLPPEADPQLNDQADEIEISDASPEEGQNKNIQEETS